MNDPTASPCAVWCCRAPVPSLSRRALLGAHGRAGRRRARRPRAAGARAAATTTTTVVAAGRWERAPVRQLARLHRRGDRRALPRGVRDRLQYTENLNDNNEWFARVQADLGAGRDIGADIVGAHVLAGRPAHRARAGRRSCPSTTSPTRSNLVADLERPEWDPTGAFSLPWQSGMTGIAYNIAEAGRELASIEDLFDPEFKGRIGMLTEMRDTVGLLMLASGVDPADADLRRRRRRLRPARAGEERRPDPPVHRQRLHGRPRVGELRRVHRLVRRHLPARPRQPEPAVRHPRRGRHAAGPTPW